MDWQQLDVPTRVGLVATVVAVLGMILPPFGMTSALVAVGSSGTAVYRSRRSGRRNQVALVCLGASTALITFVVVGSLLYAASLPA